MQRLVTIDLTHADLGRFEAYEAKVLQLVADHGGRLEFRVRSVDGASETHLLHFPDPAAYEAYRADPRRLAAQGDWRACGATLSVTEVAPILAGNSPPGRLYSQEEAWLFAREWAEAWNEGDLDRILSHYSDDFEMASPLIAERVGEPSGRLKGKAAIRAYWEIGIAAKPPLRFELLDALGGVDVIAIYYRSATRGRRVVERLRFNALGLAIEAEANYGEDL